MEEFNARERRLLACFACAIPGFDEAIRQPFRGSQSTPVSLNMLPENHWVNETGLLALALALALRSSPN